MSAGVNIQCLCSAFSIVGIAIEDLSMIDPDMMINKISRERKKMTQTQSEQRAIIKSIDAKIIIMIYSSALKLPKLYQNCI